jgi:hypothetical protein
MVVLLCGRGSWTSHHLSQRRALLLLATLHFASPLPHPRLFVLSMSESNCVEQGGNQEHKRQQLKHLLQQLQSSRKSRKQLGAASSSLFNFLLQNESLQSEGPLFTIAELGMYVAGIAAAGRGSEFLDVLGNSLELAGVGQDNLELEALKSLSRLGLIKEAKIVYTNITKRRRATESESSLILFCLRKAGRYTEGVSFFESDLQPLHPSLLAWTNYLHCLAMLGSAGAAARSLAVMDSFGVPPDAVAVSQALRACASSSPPEWMLASRILAKYDPVIDLQALASATAAYSAAGRWDEAVGCMERSRSFRADGAADPYCATAAITACGRAGRMADALSLQRALVADERRICGAPGSLATTACYNAAISACKRNPSRGSGLLREMKCRGVERNCWTYNTVLMLFSKKGALPGQVEQLIADMLEDEIAPDQFTLNTAVRAASDAAAAGAILQRFRKKGIVPDVVTFNALLHPRFQVSGAALWDLMNYLDASDIHPDDITVATACRTMSITGESNQARAVYNRFAQQGWAKGSPGWVAFTALIHCAAADNNVHDALSWVQRARAKGIKDNRVFEAALELLVRLRRGSEATKLLKMMAEDGILIPVAKSTSEHSASRSVNGSNLDTLSLLPEQGSSRHIVLTAAIIAASSAGKYETALRLFNSMRKLNLPRNRDVYAAALEACEKTGRYEVASTLLAQARASGGFSITEGMLHSVILAGDSDRAAEILEDMIRQHSHPSPRSISLVVAMRVKEKGLPAGSALMEQLISRPELQPLNCLATYRALVGILNDDGYFDEVDHFFVQARERGLVETVMRDGPELDLYVANIVFFYSLAHAAFLIYSRNSCRHNLSTPMALSAVRNLMWDVFRSGEECDDLIIITGRGKGSKGQEPVLRPRVMAMLHEDFFPPLDW